MEAKKWTGRGWEMFLRFPFIYWGKFGELKSDVETFCWRLTWIKIETECFFLIFRFFCKNYKYFWRGKKVEKVEKKRKILVWQKYFSTSDGKIFITIEKYFSTRRGKIFFYSEKYFSIRRTCTCLFLVHKSSASTSEEKKTTSNLAK